MQPIRPTVSIIMPVLNEAESIAEALVPLQTLRAHGAEVIVVDGGSCDATLAQARAGCDLAISAPRGRACQMNAGALHARADILLFLHADTRLPEAAIPSIRYALGLGETWGRFDVRITGAHRMLRVVAQMMNWRSRLTGIATGDQAIFCKRDAFRSVGGYPEQPLMEDIALSRALKRIARPVCLDRRVVTSGRRWEKHGVWKTIALMWRLRAAYALGADPVSLARQYGYGP